MEKETLLDHIKELRRKNNLSQTDMANKLHISLKTYQNIEYGVTKIDIDRLEKIIQLLDTTWDDFFNKDKTCRSTADQQTLYEKLIEEKNRYIERLEKDIFYYQKIIENRL